MENRAIVNRIIPFSNVDGPGNRLAIFFQECNINCVYCHNPETINKCINCLECIPGCPTGAIKSVDGRVVYNEKLCTLCDQCIKVCEHNSSPRTHAYSIKELLEVIEKYKLFIRGITVSGGEPTLQAGFIAELFKAVKSLNLTCFVDTNGFFEKSDPSIIELIGVTDKFMVDIKAVNNLEKLCQCDMKNNIDNLKYLLSLNKVHEVRTVLINDYFDFIKTLDTVGGILKDYPEVTYKLIKVHTIGLKDHQREKIKDKIPSDDEVQMLVERIKKLGVKSIEIL